MKSTDDELQWWDHWCVAVGCRLPSQTVSDLVNQPPDKAKRGIDVFHRLLTDVTFLTTKTTWRYQPAKNVLQTQINLERRYWLKSSAFASLMYCESAVFLLHKEFEGNPSIILLHQSTQKEKVNIMVPNDCSWNVSAYARTTCMTGKSKNT